MNTVAELAALVEGVVVGDPLAPIDDVAPLRTATARDVSFLTHPRYRSALATTDAGAILITRAAADQLDGELGHTQNLILCDDPYLAMAVIAAYLHGAARPEPGVASGAQVHASARVDPSAQVCTGAVVDAAAVVGAGSTIGATAYVGREAQIGAEVVLHPGARVLDRCRVGDRVILHAGAVIGADGFGYAVDESGRRHKIPQRGVVVVEDEVEVGANATIDRATFGETRIGRGTKIDNLVQVAHNVVTGEDCVVVSQSGIAGSARLGARVVMGAQTGVVGHVDVADDVTLGARGAIGRSITDSGVYSGAPAIPHRKWLKATLVARELPELRRRLAALEAKCAREEDDS